MMMSSQFDIGIGVPTLSLIDVKFITTSVSWPISAPKLCCMIIATTAQDQSR